MALLGDRIGIYHRFEDSKDKRQCLKIINTIYNRKKMVKQCQICGRNIKSGRLYCWEHRNRNEGFGKGRKNTLFQNLFFFIFTSITSLTLFYFIQNTTISLPERFIIIKYILLGLGLVSMYIAFIIHKKLNKNDLWDFNPKNFIGGGIFVLVITMAYKSMLASFENAKKYILLSNIFLFIGALIVLVGIIGYLRPRK